MTLKKEKDSFNKLVQLLSEMVGQAISLSVVEPETKTADFVKNWLDNHYEEVDAAFGSSCCYGKGLDEAAEEYTDNPNNYATWTEHFGAFDTVDDIALVEKAFKAGAKWMAEQGWHEEAVIKGSEDVVWLNYGVELPIDLAKYFKDGDKVIVQIRKKEVENEATCN